RPAQVSMTVSQARERRADAGEVLGRESRAEPAREMRERPVVVAHAETDLAELVLRSGLEDRMPKVPDEALPQRQLRAVIAPELQLVVDLEEDVDGRVVLLDRAAQLELAQLRRHVVDRPPRVARCPDLHEVVRRAMSERDAREGRR